MTIFALGDYRPELPENGDYWVAPDANVIGQVIVESGVSILYFWKFDNFLHSPESLILRNWFVFSV